MRMGMMGASFLPDRTPSSAAATGEGETSAAAGAEATRTKAQKPPTITTMLPTLTGTAGPMLELAGKVLRATTNTNEVKHQTLKSRVCQPLVRQKTDTENQGNGTFHLFSFSDCICITQCNDQVT